MKIATQATMDRRVRFFIIGVSLLILLCILVSISQFHVAPRASRPQIALLLTGGRDEAGWNRAHYRGAMAAAKTHEIDLIVREHVTARSDTCRNIIEGMAAQGIRTFLLAGHFNTPEILDMLKEYPRFLFCVADASCEGKNILGYSLRFYEARYLSGILAGQRTRSGLVGYIAPFPTPEVNAGINAFALGVQRENPNARVQVVWTGAWNASEREKAAVARLWQTETDVLTYQQDGPTVANAAEQAGIDYIGYQEVFPRHRHYLTAIQTEWQGLYNDLFRRYHLRDMESRGGIVWPGLLHWALSLSSFGEWVPAQEQDEVEAEELNILHGKPVFSGELFDRDGRQRCFADETLRASYVRKNMNWLLRGVEVVGTEQ